MPRAKHPQTLKTTLRMEGHGLHGGQPARVLIHPVDRPTGLRFFHAPSGVEIPARAERVGDLSLATTLVGEGIKLGTVEHLLSALMGLEVEHALIEVDGPELPILDGSAHPWVQAIESAGIHALEGRRRVMRILRTVEVEDRGRWIRVSPFDGLRVRYSIDFPHPAIGRQARELTLSPEKYRREVAAARTFCMDRDIEMMRAMGLALGGSLDNAVVFTDQGPMNESLRFEDEAVRHKMLDLIGDLALLGAPLEGLVEAHAAGHAMHVALAKAILADPSAWTWAEVAAAPRRPALFHGLSAHPQPA